MSGENLHVFLGNLAKYFTQLPPTESLKEIIETDLEQIKQRQEDDFNVASPELYTILQHVLNGSECCDLLQDIYNDAANSRKEQGFHEYDTWDFLAKYIPVEKFLNFVYATVTLWQFEPLNITNRKLSFNTAKMYLILLTIPGAKRCGIFDEDVVAQTVQITSVLSYFKMPEYEKRFRSHERTQIQQTLFMFLEDLCLVLKFVAFAEFKDIKKVLVKALKNILQYNHANGYENIYSYNLTQKSYEALEALCLPIHGDVKESVYQVFCVTSVFYAAKFIHPPSRKMSFATPEVTIYGETVIDFFLHLLKNSGTPTASVLTTFIQSILTNPDENLKNEEYSYLLDIGVRYESEVYKQTCTSLLPWLQTCCDSKEIIQRCNAVEFLSKMLLIDTDIDYSLFASDTPPEPREVEILKLLFEKILDVNNGVKQKALNGLIKAFNGGNRKVTEILKTAFVDKEEKYGICQEIKDLIGKLFHLLLHNALAHIRRAVILLMEILATRNPEIIDCEEFRTVVMELPDDSTILVRKQSLVILNSLLEKFANHGGLIELWTKCFLILMKDSDAKIVELAMNSLKSNVFDNIKSYENTTKEKDKMPWEILRSILKHGNRNVLKNVVDDWVKNKALTQKNLTIIESHIYTSNSTEAWLLLSLIAKKMKSKNPDAVMKAFGDSIQCDMYNSPITVHLILEVISSWIPDFSRPALNTIYQILFDILKSGSSSPTLITFIYDVCHSIKTFAKSNNEWIHELNRISKGYIIEHKDDYLHPDVYDERYLNYLLLYADSCVNLPRGPEYDVMHTMIEFIRTTADLKTHSHVSSNQNTKICTTVIVLTRLGVRDVEIASAIVPHFARILKKSHNKSVVGDLIACLTDLCKKHTSCVESSMQEVTNKLKSFNHEIRALALRSLRELVMQDYIKMRGRVLLNILTAIVDPYEDISNEACMIILTFVEEKNKHLLNTCFLESVFVYNGYLQYDGFELFPVSEFDNEPSALQGDRKRQERFSLYQFFIDNIDTIPLLMLLKNINLIYERLKHKKFVKCMEGVDTIHDLLHIFKQICGVKAKLDKSKEENPDAEEKPGGINAVDSRPARGAPTMALALQAIEKMVQIYPKFYSCARDYDASLEESLDSLGEAIAANFKNLIEFSVPEFWDRHRKPKNTPKKSNTPRKRRGRKGSSASTASMMTEDNDSILTDDS